MDATVVGKHARARARACTKAARKTALSDWFFLVLKRGERTVTHAGTQPPDRPSSLALAERPTPLLAPGVPRDLLPGKRRDRARGGGGGPRCDQVIGQEAERTDLWLVSVS
ncbi:hypothetical protein H696_02218 [Fonticula alba]|uniref:Uncharacterized protein n=1 Tax=Fonticula alba TaxID=691883 RepID=A0A058ZBG3_FONAL|nr:hypothetical protein H696_02218 [Fonticula alba]KCV71271.1 hypothetical protein H696_02218 [Fonticula alba]|eukprot:XP_009494394.1 hypothetical protein H696_02218 [Fonticula alba]